MPSYARKHQLNRSLLCHVFSRSNARLPIFREPQDFSHFIVLVKGYAVAFGHGRYIKAAKNSGADSSEKTADTYREEKENRGKINLVTLCFPFG